MKTYASWTRICFMGGVSLAFLATGCYLNAQGRHADGPAQVEQDKGQSTQKLRELYKTQTQRHFFVERLQKEYVENSSDDLITLFKLQETLALMKFPVPLQTPTGEYSTKHTNGVQVSYSILKNDPTMVDIKTIRIYQHKAQTN